MSGQILKSGNTIFRSGNAVFRCAEAIASNPVLLGSVGGLGTLRGFCIDAVNRKGYAVDQANKVSIVNLDTLAITGTISAAAASLSTPIECTIDVAGQRLMVANYGSSSVSVINLSNNSLIRNFAVLTRDGIVFDRTYNRIITYSGTTMQVFSGSDYTLMQQVTTPAAVADQAYIFEEVGKLFLLSASTGKVLCYQLSNLSVSPTIITSAQSGLSSGKGVSVNKSTGELLLANNGNLSVLSAFNFNSGYRVVPVTVGGFSPIAVDDVNNNIYTPSGSVVYKYDLK